VTEVVGTTSLFVDPTRVAFDPDAGHDEGAGKRVVEGCTPPHRSLVRARPVRDLRQPRSGAVLDHQVEVLGEPLDETEAFGQRCAALEPELEADLMQRPQSVRHPVVLLDERRGDPRVARDDADELLELQVLVDKAHPLAPASARHRSTSASVAFVPYSSAMSRSRFASQRPSRRVDVRRCSRSAREVPAISWC